MALNFKNKENENTRDHIHVRGALWNVWGLGGVVSVDIVAYRDTAHMSGTGALASWGRPPQQSGAGGETVKSEQPSLRETPWGASQETGSTGGDSGEWGAGAFYAVCQLSLVPCTRNSSPLVKQSSVSCRSLGS